MKLIVAKDKIVSPNVSSIKIRTGYSRLQQAPTIHVSDGHQSPMLFVNGRTRLSISVDNVQRWNYDRRGVFFRTNAAINEANSVFAGGDEIRVKPIDQGKRKESN